MIGRLFVLVVVPAWLPNYFVLPTTVHTSFPISEFTLELTICGKAQGRFPRSCHEVRHPHVV